MDVIARRIAVAAMLVLGAAAGGYALGNFATATDSGALSNGSDMRSGAEELAAEAATINRASPARAAPDAPNGYVCEGCDSRSTNEMAVADDFQPYDSAPLPPYRTPPEDRVSDLPVIEADRAAPDAARRRAATPQPSPRLPVLAADRVPAASNAAGP